MRRSRQPSVDRIIHFPLFSIFRPLRIKLEQLQVEIVKLSRIVDDRQHGLPAAK